MKRRQYHQQLPHHVLHRLLNTTATITTTTIKPSGQHPNTININQDKVNDTYQTYTFCEQKDSKTTCYMIPIYIVKAKGKIIRHFLLSVTLLFSFTYF